VLQQGSPLPPELALENLDALREGASNLVAQVENVRAHGVPGVCAFDRFATDSDGEVALVRELALAAGCEAAETSDLYARGGEGGLALAEAVARVADADLARFEHLYELDASPRTKIHTLATRMYGAGSVQYSALALERLAAIQERGFGNLPVCMAKTQYSLSHDPQFKGRPRGFVFPVRDVRLAAGAGFLVVLAGEIMTMPGLGRRPGYCKVDLDREGRIVGLF
jgi:formyltetrahydrofolate synthetase